MTEWLLALVPTYGIWLLLRGSAGGVVDLGCRLFAALRSDTGSGLSHSGTEG